MISGTLDPQHSLDPVVESNVRLELGPAET